MADIAVGALLEKLAALMGDEYKKLKGLRKEVSFLKRELSDMNALLQKMDDADELDLQAKNWRKDIIEMSYDVEDYIDDFMNHVGEVGDNVGALWKVTDYLRTFKHRHRLANQFKEIKTLVIEAGERRKRYMLDQGIPSTIHVTVDPRLSTLYKKSESLVGIDSQKEDIVRWVMDEDQKLKVMSIVGFGGLGKTTLANEVSREVGLKFSCKAFLSISQNPDIIKLLNSLLSQLGLEPYFHPCELQDPINKIIAHLQDKRYFIIVDDLWDIRVWNTISCAFPQNNLCSRVLITTRIEDVARVSCGNHGFIHYMQPLSEQDSRKLFFNIIFESEDACPLDFIEVSCKILKKCGGLPLAITTMASMIACQPTRSRGQWAEYIEHSLDAKFATNPTYEDMIHILDFSYKNLPHHLKACFLYLGIYPEDHMISRVELVRRWVAEGFISCSSGHDTWDVAERYFCELVNRSMIQPTHEDYDDDFYNEVRYCRVHDMMLELILRKCKEDNFVSLIDTQGMLLKGQDKAIRRLTTVSSAGSNCGTTVMTNSRHLSHIRSLNIFTGNCMIPKLAAFKFMRLLFLDIRPDGEMTFDLSDINHLTQLRYLHVVTPYNNVLLPSQIHGLRFLETLNFSRMKECRDIPDFVDVPHLSHVSVPSRFGLANGIGKVNSLVTLRGYNLAMSSLESVKGLGNLTALSELSLSCRKRGIGGGGMIPLSEVIAALISSLRKLGNLRKLHLWFEGIIYCEDTMLEQSFLPPFHNMKDLSLKHFIFSSVPRWIRHLCCLRYLWLGARQIHQEDLDFIGSNLPSLICLSLEIPCGLTKRIVIGGTMGFKVLKFFNFWCDSVSCLAFEVGAMPNLQKLEITIDPLESDAATPLGLQHLASLKSIEVCEMGEMQARRDLMQSMFQEAVNALPTHPEIEFAISSNRPEEMKMT